jgi:hypothetical protein
LSCRELWAALLLGGEAMSEVCRALGISRKTGYKIFERSPRLFPVAPPDRDAASAKVSTPTEVLAGLLERVTFGAGNLRAAVLRTAARS